MKKGFFILTLFCFAIYYSQEKDTIQLTELVVSAKAPVTQQKISKSEIESFNLGQDVPMLVDQTPSAVATSDAGNGIGYTGIRIRGTDASRILVTIDGVSINDSESQSVFWVNMPDLMSSANSITIQRGVGSSSNGTSNFGGSVQINTQDFSDTKKLNYLTSGGSFGTYRNSLEFQSGKFANEKLQLNLRLSQIHSDGYIDRAFSKLRSAQVQLKYKKSDNSSLKVNYLSGKEKTYQAWYGVDKYTLETNRKFNFAGAIYNEDYSEILGFYDNQTDNYAQDHLFTHWDKKWNDNLSSKVTGFFTYGRGYYEELAQFQNPEDYKIDDNTISDLVRRKWLKNNYYGVNSYFNYKKSNWNLEGNLALSQYVGNHFGEVVNSAFYALPEKVEYYRNQSTKNEISTYLKSTYNFGRLKLYGDIQFRNVHYFANTSISGETAIDDNPDFNKTYHFWNPKVGLDYNLQSGKLYTLFAISNREPTRTDLLQNLQIAPERLYDYELGYHISKRKWSLNTNFYYMNYQNQMVLSGTLDDVGNPIRENSGKSYRLGWEMDGALSFKNNFKLFGNLSISTNKNIGFFANENGELTSYGNTEIAFSPQLISSFGISKKLFKIVDIQLLNKYVSAQYLNNLQSKNLKLDPYFLTNFYLQITPEFHINQRLIFNVQFNNIFNQLYESNGYVYDDLPYYYPQAGFNFLIGMRLEW